MDWLKILVKVGAITLAESFKSFDDILSCPIAFDNLIVESNLKTPVSEIFWISNIELLDVIYDSRVVALSGRPSAKFTPISLKNSLKVFVMTHNSSVVLSSVITLAIGSLRLLICKFVYHLPHLFRILFSIIKCTHKVIGFRIFNQLIQIISSSFICFIHIFRSSFFRLFPLKSLYAIYFS